MDAGQWFDQFVVLTVMSRSVFLCMPLVWVCIYACIWSEQDTICVVGEFVSGNEGSRICRVVGGC